METPFFPVGLHELPSHLAIEELKEMEFQIGKVKVEAKFVNHPGICAGYRLFTSGGAVAYRPDIGTYQRLQPQLAGRGGNDGDGKGKFSGGGGGRKEGGFLGVGGGGVWTSQLTA